MYDPQQLNRYAFERNNPWKNTDETGHVIATTYIVASALLGFGVGIVVSIGYQKAFHDKVDYGRALRSGIVGAIISAGTAGVGLATGAVATGAVVATETAMTGIGAEVTLDIATSIVGEVLEDEPEDSEKYCLNCIKVPIKDEDGNIIGTRLIDNKGQDTLMDGGSSGSWDNVVYNEDTGTWVVEGSSDDEG